MNQTLTIAKRELSSLFFSPIAYLVMGVFALVSSRFFLLAFIPGMAAEMRYEFGWLVWILALIAPAISMRLLSEEMRQGTLEVLMTAPVTDTQVVVGKWLGALAFFLIVLLAPLLGHIVVLEINAEPDYGPVLTGLLGLGLVGGLYMAVGLFFSAMTHSQIISFLLTVLVAGFFTIGMYQLSQAQEVPLGLRQAMHYLNVSQQFEAFSKGLVDTSNFVYFLSGIGLFLFLAVKVLESRRWR